MVSSSVPSSQFLPPKSMTIESMVRDAATMQNEPIKYGTAFFEMLNQVGGQP
jgi:hypothetical protein